MYTDGRQRGVSLIELVMFIVVVSIALAGIMLVMNQTVGHSGDTLLRKQALAVAESLLEEIEARPFSGAASAVVTSNRKNFHIVSDYNNYASSGVYDISGNAVSGLSGYDVAVSVASNVLGITPAGSAVEITVTVTPPAGAAISITGYRTNY